MEWIDYYFHMLWLPSHINFNAWTKNPPDYIEITDEYGIILEVVNKMIKVLSINLGL
eukprot:Gb_14025 [translate_table: standard]